MFLSLTVLSATLPAFIIDNHFHFLSCQQSRTVRECGPPLCDCQQLSASRNNSPTTTRRECDNESHFVDTYTHIFMLERLRRVQMRRCLTYRRHDNTQESTLMLNRSLSCSRANNTQLTFERQCVNVTASSLLVSNTALTVRKQSANVTASR